MTIIGGGQFVDIVNLSVSSTVDTQIATHNQQAANALVIQERTTNGLQIRFSPGDSEYFTLPSGNTLSLNLLSNEKGQFPLYVRAASSTSTVEILFLYGG